MERFHKLMTVRFRSNAGGLRHDRASTRRQVPGLVLETTNIIHLAVVVVLVGD